jgi:hypothetical protein
VEKTIYWQDLTVKKKTMWLGGRKRPVLLGKSPRKVLFMIMTQNAILHEIVQIRT